MNIIKNFIFGNRTGARSLRYYYGRILIRLYGLKKEKSYSTINEDNVIDWLTGYKEKGTYIDIGANNPDHTNNTKLFYERGWRGINIEPNVKGYQAFLERRPEDTNLNVGIGVGEVEYYENPNDSCRNTCVKSFADAWTGTEWEMKNKRTIKLKPLSEVFEENGLKMVDFIKIDVETFEHEVLKSNDWTKYKARVLCIEGSGYDYLKKYGYRKAFWDGNNSYYKLKKS